ncbi:hypothetical protein [Nostoc flagelliforme]|nr:hypothetical protein [Nostoc flagelliforme]
MPDEVANILQYGSVKAQIVVNWVLFPKMEIQSGASQGIIVGVS